MTLWKDLTELEQLQCIYSDTYKDTFGVRPRFISDENWNNVEWLRQEVEVLYSMNSQD